MRSLARSRRAATTRGSSPSSEVALSADLDAGHAGDRYQVVLHVEASPGPDATGTADLPGVGVLEIDDAAIRVSAETAQRLACDASVVAMRCDAHHIDHWMDGGPTSLDNLVLCRRHHRVVHEGKFTLRWRPDHTRTLPTWEGGPFNLGYAVEVLYVGK